MRFPPLYHFPFDASCSTFNELREDLLTDAFSTNTLVVVATYCFDMPECKSLCFRPFISLSRSNDMNIFGSNCCDMTASGRVALLRLQTVYCYYYIDVLRYCIELKN